MAAHTSTLARTAKMDVARHLGPCNASSTLFGHQASVEHPPTQCLSSLCPLLRGRAEEVRGCPRILRRHMKALPLPSLAL